MTDRFDPFEVLNKKLASIDDLNKKVDDLTLNVVGLTTRIKKLENSKIEDKKETYKEIPYLCETKILLNTITPQSLYDLLTEYVIVEFRINEAHFTWSDPNFDLSFRSRIVNYSMTKFLYIDETKESFYTGAVVDRFADIRKYNLQTSKIYHQKYIRFTDS